MKLLIFIRSVVGTFLFILFTGLMASLGVVFNFLFNRRFLDNWVITTWGKGSCFLLNIKVKVIGLDNFKKTKGAIVLFNHSSFVDVLAMAGYLNNMRFGAKAELFKIPVFGLCMKRLGTLPIERSQREAVFKVYDEAKVRFLRGEKFALSPEGGRYHGGELSPFKSGPFVFAIGSQVPLIPVVISGAYECWPKGQILANSHRWQSKLTLTVLESYSTEGLQVEERQKIQADLYARMNHVFVTTSFRD